MNERNRLIKEGFQAGLSIALGYIPVAITFGLIAKDTGITFLECLGFSAIVYAGASQFLAMKLISADASLMSIILTTLLFNFRHFIMSTSLSHQLGNQARHLRPLIAFWTTDESFSFASLKQKVFSPYFFLPMAATAYISWSFGSVLGYSIGSIFPPLLSQSMSIALYAMFVGILAPEFKRSLQPLWIVLTAGLLNMIIYTIPFVPMGWDIIIVIVLTVFIWHSIDQKKTNKAGDTYE